MSPLSPLDKFCLKIRREFLEKVAGFEFEAIGMLDLEFTVSQSECELFQDVGTIISNEIQEIILQNGLPLEHQGERIEYADLNDIFTEYYSVILNSTVFNIMDRKFDLNDSRLVQLHALFSIDQREYKILL